MENTAAAEIFGVGEVGTATSRYTLKGVTVPTLSGGIVGSGKMTGKKDATGQLVHTSIPGRQEQSIDMGAVASAVVGGVIPYPQLVAAFAAGGKLDDLKKAVAAHGKAE